MAALNGIPAQIYLWILTGALGLVGVLFSFAVHLHIKFDEAFQKRVEDWMKEREEQLHRHSNRISAVETQRRWQDEDNKGD